MMVPEAWTTGVWVEGSYTATALGRQAAIDRIVSRLEAAGWMVLGYTTSTDTAEVLGIPIPSRHRLRVRLHRPDRTYTAAEAAEAVRAATAPEGWDLDLIGTYSAELRAEVVEPTVRDITSPTRWPAWLRWGLIGSGTLVVAVAVAYAAGEVRRWTR